MVIYQHLLAIEKNIELNLTNILQGKNAEHTGGYPKRPR